MEWTLDKILTATQGELLYGSHDHVYIGIEIDSRTISPRNLFIAVSGARHDGRRFIPDVLAKGVRGVMIQNADDGMVNHGDVQLSGATCIEVPDTIRALGALAAYQRSAVSIPVVAITGSNGKTTTRQLIAGIMAEKFNTLATQGNLNNEIGLPLTLFRLTDGHQAAVLELGMNHPGEIDRLGAICRPTVGVITNVGPAHLEFLESIEGVARAKAELIQHIDSHGTLILNADDPHVADMAHKAAQRRVIFFGFGHEVQVRARDVKDTFQGQTFELVLFESSIHIELKARGRFMVSNALAAASVGVALGIEIEDIRAGLESFRQGQGRMSVTRTVGGIGIIDDTYNANPASMKAAIDTLIALKGAGPGIIIVGDMLELGQEAAHFHRQLGGMAATSADRLYAFGDFAGDVADGALKAGMKTSDVFTGTKEEIADHVLRHLTPSTWVLVKGSRGVSMETIVTTILSALKER